MATQSKTKKIESLAKFLQKRYKTLPTPPERTVLEHLIYAALLENASFEQADAAFAVMESYFIDWNEIRVSTVKELADTFPMLPVPMAAGDRIRKTLQGVFEKTYMFDLEDLRKKGKNLGQAVEFLESVHGCSRFMTDYTAQMAFGGHSIPIDEGAMRVFRLLGLSQVNKERTREEVPGLERAIPKKTGLAFSLQLHHFGAEFYANADSTELRSLLKPIDADATKRDCSAPVLLVPKAPPKPELPVVPPVLAFAHVDDDDFEDDTISAEAEFIPDESGLRPEDDLPAKYDDDDEPPFSVPGKKKGGKDKPSKEFEKSAAKAEKPVKGVSSPSHPKPKAATDAIESTSKKGKTETAKPKPHSEPTSPAKSASQPPPVKTEKIEKKGTASPKVGKEIKSPKNTVISAKSEGTIKKKDSHKTEKPPHPDSERKSKTTQADAKKTKSKKPK